MGPNMSSGSDFQIVLLMVRRMRTCIKLRLSTLVHGSWAHPALLMNLCQGTRGFISCATPLASAKCFGACLEVHRCCFPMASNTGHVLEYIANVLRGWLGCQFVTGFLCCRLLGFVVSSLAVTDQQRDSWSRTMTAFFICSIHFTRASSVTITQQC